MMAQIKSKLSERLIERKKRRVEIDLPRDILREGSNAIRIVWTVWFSFSTDENRRKKRAKKRIENR